MTFTFTHVNVTATKARKLMTKIQEIREELARVEAAFAEYGTDLSHPAFTIGEIKTLLDKIDTDARIIAEGVEMVPELIEWLDEYYITLDEGKELVGKANKWLKKVK